MLATRVRLPHVVALIVVCGLVAGCSPQALSFTIGDCINLPDAEQIDDYESVDCDEAHDAEVFALPQHPAADDAPFPETEALTQFANERCEAAFQPYVGTEYALSAIFFTALTPGEEAWEDAGDREVVCLLVGEPGADGFAQLVGSKRDSGE